MADLSVYRRIVHRIGRTRSAAALGRRYGSRIDRLLFAATRGRLTSIGGATAPVLLLTTTGRRSGLARTTPVIFIRSGDGLVVSSENFGQRRPAAWPLNLDADPRATVQVGGERLPCLARRLSEAEADSYWDRLLEVWPAHADYLRRSGQRHTFLLTPAREPQRTTSVQRASRGRG